MRLEVYTDGAYSPKRNQMGIGIVFIRDGTKILEYSRKYNGGTNNKAELGAIIVAMRIIVKPIETLIIYSDSMYCIGCITLEWKRKKNLALWEEFDNQLLKLKELCSNIEFKHIKGHDSSVWNNYVDKLAVKASQLV